MKKKLAIIGAIEGTEDRLLEKDYLFLINTFIKNNKNTDIDIHLLQPTNNDILPETKIELERLGVVFNKNIAPAPSEPSCPFVASPNRKPPDA